MIARIKRYFHKFTHSLFFVVLLKKFDAVSVSLVAIAYGWFLISHPRLLNYSETYDIVSQIFTSQVVGILFVIAGITKILSIVFTLRQLKIVSISCLFGLWMFFGTALMLSDATNTIYIHCYGWALVCLGVVLREMVE